MGIATSTPAAGPLVSVVMITYNHRPYIEQAVESVLNQQTDFEFELLLADDCSTDGTREYTFACGERHPKRVRLVTSEKNVGAHANLVRAERACRGRYVAYCEGDDHWQDPHKLAKQVAFLDARPGHVMVHSHCHRFLVEQQRLLRNSLTVPVGLDDTRAYEDLLLGVRYALTVTVMARRDALFDALDQAPECTDPKWPMGDTQRWLELARRGSVGCIHEPLATTNILAESAGQSRDPAKRMRFMRAARALQLHYLTKYPVTPEIDRAVHRQLAASLLHSAYHIQDGATAEEMFLDFERHGGRPDLNSRLLLWGSKSAWRHGLVYPCVKVQGRWRRLKKRFFTTA